MCHDGAGMAQSPGGRHRRAVTRRAPPGSTQGLLWTRVPYQEEAPAITSPAELAGAIEHLHYAVFRRYANQLTRAERSRLDNTIDNALFKIDRYLLRLAPTPRRPGTRTRCAACASRFATAASGSSSNPPWPAAPI